MSWSWQSAGLVCLVLCGGVKDASANAGQQAKRSITRLVRSQRAFALKLYREMAKQQAGNWAISPLSASHVMSALLMGARQRTARELRQALQLSVSSAQTANGWKAFRHKLSQQNQSAQGQQMLLLAGQRFGEDGSDKKARSLRKRCPHGQRTPKRSFLCSELSHICGVPLCSDSLQAAF